MKNLANYLDDYLDEYSDINEDYSFSKKLEKKNIVKKLRNIDEGISNYANKRRKHKK